MIQLTGIYPLDVNRRSLEERRLGFEAIKQISGANAAIDGDGIYLTLNVTDKDALFSNPAWEKMVADHSLGGKGLPSGLPQGARPLDLTA